MPIRVLAVDDHEMVLLGLPALLAGTGIQIIATAKSAVEAVKQARKHSPEVILMEVRLNQEDSMTLLKQIRHSSPMPSAIIFSSYDSQIHRARALALGAAGYVLKRDQSTRLIASIQQAAGGDQAWRADELKDITGGLTDNPDVCLTRRESEVLQQISHGLTNSEIAAMLQISVETVKEYVRNILRKLGVRRRIQAAVWAVRKQIA